MSYRDGLRRKILTCLDECQEAAPDYSVAVRELVSRLQLGDNVISDVEEQLAYLGERGLVNYTSWAPSGYGHGTARITARGQDAIGDPQRVDKRDDVRQRVLRFLDQKEHEQPYHYCRVSEVATALRLDNPAVSAAASYLAERGLVRRTLTAQDWPLRITPTGRDAVEHPAEYFGTLQRSASPNQVTVYAPNATIGQLQAGGSGNMQRGSIVQTLNHPQASEAIPAISAARDALRAAATLPAYQKEEGERALSAIEAELARPLPEQDRQKITYFADNLVKAAGNVTSLVSLAEQVLKLATGHFS